jgi:hypothetical protein
VTIVQITIRDEPENVNSFLRSCGALIESNITAEITTQKIRIAQPFTFSFQGTAPITNQNKSEAQTVIDTLVPERRQEQEKQTWGCSATSLATLLKVQWVTPTFTHDDSKDWLCFNYPLLEISFRMLCDNVPDRWLRISYQNILWTQMLWCRPEQEVRQLNTKEEFGGIFTDKEEQKFYRLPWKMVAYRGGETFLRKNGWVTRVEEPRHITPLKTTDPALRLLT